jgi:hypothetical protein
MLTKLFVLVGKEREPTESVAGNQYQNECGKNTLDAAGVKFGEAERALFQILKNNGGYQVAGDHKENIDTYESPLQSFGKGMEGDDRKYGDRSQTVNIGAVLGVREMRL